MDQSKIGEFIASRRKACALTQSQLAQKLCITDRAVSKWETGRSLPDTSIMLELCEILGITVNELLSGEVVEMENYNEKSERLLFDMIKQKEEADRRFLSLEIVIGVLSVIILLGFNFVAAFADIPDVWVGICIVLGFVIGIAGLGFATRIEQIAGYYGCAKCGHRYVPSFNAVLWSMHFGRTRFMRCPECHRYSWQKKYIEKK